MTVPLPQAEVEIATLAYTAPDRVEVRFKPGVEFTSARIAELMQVRARLGVSGKHRVLMILPEVIDFDVDIVQVEHYTVTPQPNTEAVAWLVRSAEDMHITRLAVGRGVPTFPWKVFMNEAEARAWLEEVVP